MGKNNFLDKYYGKNGVVCLITKELVSKINYLARKQRNEGLTVQEQTQQKELREEYLKGIRHQVVDALQSAGCKTKSHGHDASCDCEACSEHEQNLHNKLH